jgi:hypothetical protein
MGKSVREFSGRTISSEDIETIKWVRRSYPKLSLTEFAGTVCEMLGWNTPAGTAKTSQCVACLRALRADGAIDMDIPEARPRRLAPRAAPAALGREGGETVTECGEISLAVAEGAATHRRWRAYVDQYHRLGCRQEFGSRLRYFVVSGGRELGCLQFSASAWALEARDRWLGWGADDRKARLHLIVNNSRFLLFPWVRVRNLASRALSMAARQIQRDWLGAYCCAPVLLETFVDRAFHSGACYRAANWECLGETKGRGRMDRGHERALSKKLVFVRPLQRDFRAVLAGEKARKGAGADGERG